METFTKFLALKKFFSIPWILGHPYLFSKEDFIRAAREQQ